MIRRTVSLSSFNPKATNEDTHHNSRKIPIQPARATNSDSDDYKDLRNKFHPAKPDWYEELYAWVLNSATKSYEAEVARYKSQLFSKLKGKANKILEIGIGTGPNLSYYASDPDVQVVGIDPNAKMEKYARSAAASAGLPLSNFEFLHAVARYKSQLFSKLKGKANKIMEIGIGTGPNLSYYASDPHVQVVGIDPNAKMVKYAQSAAASAGLPLSNFEFLHAVGEVIPLSDESVDAVVGTLVLCSVKDVDMTLKEVMRVLRPGGLYVFVEHVAAKDGTFHRFLQRILDPLQQTISDGCHLSRETGNNISKAGFSSVELDMAFLKNATFVNPHIYGIAYK